MFPERLLLWLAGCPAASLTAWLPAPLSPHPFHNGISPSKCTFWNPCQWALVIQPLTDHPTPPQLLALDQNRARGGCIAQEVSQCQDSSGLGACSGSDQASLLWPLPFSAHSPIVSHQGKLPRREAWRVGLDGHPAPIPTPPKARPGPSTGLPTKGQGPQMKTGWERVARPSLGWGSQLENLGVRKNLVLSLPPCGARGGAVLGL